MSLNDTPENSSPPVAAPRGVGEEDFRAIFENARDAIGVSACGVHVGCNPAYQALFGYARREALIGLPVLDLIAPAERAVIRERIARRARGEQEPLIYETRGLRADGSEFDAEIHVSAYEKMGELYTVVIAHDITEHKRAQEDLAASERRFREMLENVQLVAVVLDREGRVTFCNDFLLQLTGWQREQVLGRPWFDLFLPADVRDEVREALLTGMEQGTLRAHRENPIMTRTGGRRLISWNNTLIHDAAGQIVGATSIGEDITERRGLEARLTAAFERERRITETLQRSLLLKKPEPIFAGLDVDTFYAPASDEALVGGDFFDVFALDGGRVALVVGDASGKGLSAAARTVEVKFALRAFLREHPFPARTLGRLNSFVYDSLRLDQREGGTFVVLALVVIDPVSGESWFSLAGAEPPLVLRANGDVETVIAGGLPLGVEPDEVYPTVKRHLEPGDLVVIATDGITEARFGDDFLGPQGLLWLAQAARSLPTLCEAGDAIVEGARRFAGGTLTDDVCLLLARRS